jgi:acyl-CoA hydrolase
MGKIIKREKSLTMTMLMTPDKANFSGKYVHGGEILKMLDHVAYACAARYSGTYAVTLSVDMVLFKDPIKIGSLVTFHASIFGFNQRCFTKRCYKCNKWSRWKNR